MGKKTKVSVRLKSSLTVLFLVLSVVTVIGQEIKEGSEHMTFKGIPIDGSLSQFTSKLVKVGFEHIRTNNYLSIFRGEFAGYKECYIGVSTSKQKDLVNRVVVGFPDRFEWSELYFNYDYLRELLTEKYGDPVESVEEFSSYTPSDDMAKMIQVRMGECNYETVYSTDLGVVSINIAHGEGGGYVKLLYVDTINYNVVREKAKKDL